MGNLNLLVAISISAGLVLALYAVQTTRSSGQKEEVESLQVTPTPTIDQPQPTSVSVTANQPSSKTESTENINWQYPNSTLLEKDGQLTFQSMDDTTTITNWYKERIKSLGLNATSFVQTKTNGNVLNKMVGSNGQTEIEVEVSKKNNQPEVLIVLDVQ